MAWQHSPMPDPGRCSSVRRGRYITSGSAASTAWRLDIPGSGSDPRRPGMSRREAEASSLSETTAGAATGAVVRHRVTTRLAHLLDCPDGVRESRMLLCKPDLGDRNDKERAPRRWG